MNIEKFLSWYVMDDTYAELGWVDDMFYVWLDPRHIEEFLRRVDVDTDGSPLEMKCYGGNGDYYFVANMSEIIDEEESHRLEHIFPKEEYQH